MKKQISYIVFFILSFAFSAQAQDDLLAKVKVSFKTGNAKQLTEHLNDQVEVSFDGEKANYNKTQSEIVLADFFKKCAPKDFTIKHQGASKEGLKYAIGTYTCTIGNFRVYLLMKQNKGVYVIDTIDFSKEE